MFCSSCGTKFNQKNNFCSSCGTKNINSPCAVITESPKYSSNYHESNSNLPNQEELTITQVLFSFEGRIGRSTFWIYALLSWLVFAVILLLIILNKIDDLIPLIWACIPIYIWVSTAIMAKRWHDRNKSGWHVLINLIPYLGWLWAFIENGFLAGDISNNAYGRPPKVKESKIPEPEENELPWKETGLIMLTIKSVIELLTKMSIVALIGFFFIHIIGLK